MAQLKAFLAKHDDIATTLIDFFEAVTIAVICIGTAPFLIWISQF